MSKPTEVVTANEHQQFREIIECFRDAMLITFTEDQHPHSRPMRIADITEDATVWFATNRRSAPRGWRVLGCQRSSGQATYV